MPVLASSVQVGAQPTAAFRMPLRVVDEPVSARGARARCAQCALNTTCTPDGLSSRESEDFASLISRDKRLRVGQALYHAGDPFHSLYVVKTGALKTVVLTDDGREQITGFHFPGDVLGIDAIGSLAHYSEASALNDASVCAIPFASLRRMSRQVEALQNHLHRLLAHEVVRDQGVMLLLGRMHADERVAAFLLNISERLQLRGLSPLEFLLPMVREDIGNYLGLSLETVSRVFSRLRGARVIEADNRRVRILDIDALRAVIGGGQAANGVRWNLVQ